MFLNFEAAAPKPQKYVIYDHMRFIRLLLYLFLLLLLAMFFALIYKVL